MKIITLPQQAFDQAAAALTAQVLADDFRPDLIVGIATGGDILARSMLAQWPGEPPAHAAVRLQRAGTKTKKRLLPRLLARLPLALCDALRRIESRALELRDRLSPPEIPVLTLPAHLQEALAKATRILIIDDAVDSGRTLQAVATALKKATTPAPVQEAPVQEAPESTPESRPQSPEGFALGAKSPLQGPSGPAAIRTAVLTITRTAPLIHPDYALYPPKTLLRFPWAPDFPHRASNLRPRRGQI